MTPAKIESLLEKHAAIIARTRCELAMNFEIPARDIILMACAEMGISVHTWDALETYSAKEQELGGVA